MFQWRKSLPREEVEGIELKQAKEVCIQLSFSIDFNFVNELNKLLL